MTLPEHILPAPSQRTVPSIPRDDIGRGTRTPAPASTDVGAISDRGGSASLPGLLRRVSGAWRRERQTERCHRRSGMEPARSRGPALAWLVELALARATLA